MIDLIKYLKAIRNYHPKLKEFRLDNPTKVYNFQLLNASFLLPFINFLLYC